MEGVLSIFFTMPQLPNIHFKIEIKKPQVWGKLKKKKHFSPEARCFLKLALAPAQYCSTVSSSTENEEAWVWEKMLIQYQEKWVHLFLEMKPDAQIRGSIQ